ncbi:MAG: glycosyltransferase family 39 protein [Gammaproteobacteria bacterium]|nr:glycosyltransferase family 39 protein [Gammaproteobacteria bacterium]
MKLSKLFENRVLLSLFAIFIVYKLVLFFIIPLTGDEAYLINLGLEPRFAYYDHPQMHPWLVYLFSFVSDSYIWFRIVGTLMVLAVGLAIYRSGRLLGYEEEPSALVAMAYVLGSSNALSVIFINDITIHLFLAWGIVFFLRFIKQERWQDALITGALAGAAFLVKYTVAVVVVPYFVVMLFYYRPQLIRFTLLFAAGLLPFVILNLYSNYSCCWSNIVFNVFNRAGQASLGNVLESVITFALVVNPILIYFFVKGYKALKQSSRLDIPFAVVAIVLLLPFGLLLLISIKKTIYFAWVINFGFILYMLLFALPRKTLMKAVYISFAYSLLIFVFFTYAGLNVDKLNQVSRYQTVTTPEAFCQEWKQSAPGYLRAATYYDEAAMLSYHCAKTMNLFMDNYFGRDDDLAVDYKALDGKDIAVLLMVEDKAVKRMKPEQIAGFFRQSEIKLFSVGKFNYALLLGQGFDYQKYRRDFILPMYKKHYLNPLPDWFPLGQCPMAE